MQAPLAGISRLHRQCLEIELGDLIQSVIKQSRAKHLCLGGLGTSIMSQPPSTLLTCPCVIDLRKCR